MSEYVLFSPVGGHDPIANYRDGALLHICRLYRPKAVYLYLSQEMCKRSQQDNRYVGALQLLSDFLNYKIEKIEVIENPNLIDVQLFDSFYEDFEKILDDIKHQYPATEILVNTSSGTPAMKSALNLISSLSKHKITALQVTTPYKKENPKNESPEEFDLESAWECNEDNAPDYENRCSEFHQVNLLAKIKKEMIVRLVEAYDYQAALAIAEDIVEFIPANATALLRAAKSRLVLDHNGVNRALQGTAYQIFPANINGRKKIVFEYLLYLQLRQKQGNYADFVRGITPVVMDLLEDCLQTNCQIDLKDYCILKGSKYNFSVKKFEQSEQGRQILQILNGYFKRSIDDYMYSSAQIYPVLQSYTKDAKLLEMLTKLQKVEQKVRNITAHQIVSVTDEWIKKQVDMSSKDIMELLKYIAAQAGLAIKKELWNSYDDMNKLIIDILCL